MAERYLGLDRTLYNLEHVVLTWKSSAFPRHLTMSANKLLHSLIVGQ